MTIHVLVEGPSERSFLDRWVRRLVPGEYVRVHPHQGKGSLPRVITERPDSKARGLLDQLPAKLRGFAAALDPSKDAVLVLVDADNDDVDQLVTSIERIAAICAPLIPLKVSVAIEEMEAFYLGDLSALARAYPSANMDLARSYTPDSICGTWELFGQVIDDDGENKVAWAEAMGDYVTANPAESRSPSFRSLIKNLNNLVATTPPARTRTKFRHSTRPSKKGDGKR